jgi:Holliday junction resolvase
MKKTNKKSDVKAKSAYKKYLEDIGFCNVRITASPADITAEKDDKKYYFEIKMTKQANSYFGAATMTEWKEAIRNPDTFKFVIAKTDENEEDFEFIEFTPDEFLKYSTIPPFKVYFNIDLNDNNKVSKRSKALQATKEILEEFISFFETSKDK